MNDRRMPIGDSRPVKVWLGVVMFFAIGAAIALAIAFHRINRGDPILGAVVVGAIAGGCGAWLVFYVVLNALKRIRG